ncbi:hypothetical protein GCM10020367_52140 [Streptomyces sannanensis]|uniref:Lipoprotein n=1 Tax=Streptomyces sannanensis TaxID=285536 RepID=A0ABP6SHS2_9ACTN
MRSTQPARLLIATLTLLAACTAHRSADAPSPPPATSRSPAGQPAGPDRTDASAGTATNPRSIRCGPHEAHIEQPVRRSADDVVVGPLSWPDLKTWATADPRDFAVSGDDFKIGVQLRAGTTVTVAVAPEARAYAGLNYGQAWSYSPAQAVTFHACPNTDTTFIGGFHVEGRRCVPLDLAVGDATPTRIVVSFFNGPCPRSSSARQSS